MSTKFGLLSGGTIILVGVALFSGGCLSTPRDFSSPSASVRVVDPSGVPITGLEVSRNWYDSDIAKDGSDSATADQSGSYTFPKIPASVGLFTGAWRKTYSHLGMCAAGRGTSTEIWVRFPGRYVVSPQDKPLHSVGQSRQDPDGVWFISRLDSNSNTLVSLTFPSTAKSIDYVLSAKRQTE
ncbi:MAG TPA: hypothetical protein VFY06_07665 [Verrucomicrobiae bacterium]|nr:hypothetical protein [Verrucomicrobiae bacterium]